MIFEKEKYYNYIKTLEIIITIIYVGIMLIAIIIGAQSGAAGLIVSILIGLLVSFLYTLWTKIKVQEMKWKFDFYTKYIERQ